MKRKLLACFGTILITVAILQGFILPDDHSDISIVRSYEASKIVGGGQGRGTDCRLENGVCGDGESMKEPCRASNGYVTGAFEGDEEPSRPYNCGHADCGEYSPSTVTIPE